MPSVGFTPPETKTQTVGDFDQENQEKHFNSQTSTNTLNGYSKTNHQPEYSSSATLINNEISADENDESVQIQNGVLSDENDDENRLLCWGNGEFGQNTQGQKQIYSSDAKPVFKFKVKAIACGASHGVLATEENEIYTWGNGTCGQLGDGECTNSSEFKLVQLYANQKNPPAVKILACGSRHTFVVLQNGRVFSFGHNNFHQLGYDPRIRNVRQNQPIPHCLRTILPRKVITVACGEKHTISLFVNGEIAVVGTNSNGQLGTGSREPEEKLKILDSVKNVRTVACGQDHSLLVTDNGELYIWGFKKACGASVDLLRPTRYFCGKRKVFSISGGRNHSLALTEDGYVYSWGSGEEGQLGHGPEINFITQPRRLKELGHEIVEMHCGLLYSIALNTHGEIFAWGQNSNVILLCSTRPTTNLFQPVKIDTGGQSVRRLSCGTWHLATITGLPARDDWPLLVQTNETIDDSDNESENTEIEKESENENDKEYTRVPSITIGEFYAPSPVPPLNGLELQRDVLPPRSDRSTRRSRSPNIYSSSFEQFPAISMTLNADSKPRKKSSISQCISPVTNSPIVKDNSKVSESNPETETNEQTIHSSEDGSGCIAVSVVKKHVKFDPDIPDIPEKSKLKKEVSFQDVNSAINKYIDQSPRNTDYLIQEQDFHDKLKELHAMRSWSRYLSHETRPSSKIITQNMTTARRSSHLPRHRSALTSKTIEINSFNEKQSRFLGEVSSPTPVRRMKTWMPTSSHSLDIIKPVTTWSKSHDTQRNSAKNTSTVSPESPTPRQLEPVADADLFGAFHPSALMSRSKTTLGIPRMERCKTTLLYRSIDDRSTLLSMRQRPSTVVFNSRFAQPGATIPQKNKEIEFTLDARYHKRITQRSKTCSELSTRRKDTDSAKKSVRIVIP